MNYRNIIKSRNLRIKILSLLAWIPDLIMLRFQYWLQMGRKLNIKNPKRFTEKLQVYKLRYRNNDMLRCTDKYEVRKYIEEKGLGQNLIPLIGIFSKVEEIDFEKLPHQFVAKTTDGGGGNQVLICKNKDDISEIYFRKRLTEWLKMPKTKQVGREWAYNNSYPRRIIIEDLISNNCKQQISKDASPLDDNPLLDYKFFCFNGDPKFLYLGDNYKNEIAFLDLDWNVLQFSRSDYSELKKIPQKPNNLNEMIKVVKCLAEDFPHVRVDLYNVDNKIYIGELTFYTASGYIPFYPDSADYTIGELFDIDF